MVTIQEGVCMKKINKKKLLLLAVFIVMFLAACQSNTGSDGKILEEKIIYLSTTFMETFNKSWFDGLFVWPIAQVINFISQYVDVVWGIALATIVVNLITIPVTISSQESQQKMQLLQPEMDKLNKKYEGRNDERSQQMKAMEMQNLYKKYDIKLSSTFLGTFIQLPVIMAMFYAVQRAESVVHGSFLGYSLEIKASEAVLSGTVIYIAIFVLMAVAQFVSMKLPSYLTKQQLKNDRRVKSYDKPKKDSATQSTEMMSYVMIVMIVFVAWSWPIAMSVYWIFSSLMNIVKTLYVQKVRLAKETK